MAYFPRLVVHRLRIHTSGRQQSFCTARRIQSVCSMDNNRSLARSQPAMPVLGVMVCGIHIYRKILQTRAVYVQKQSNRSYLHTAHLLLGSCVFPGAHNSGFMAVFRQLVRIKRQRTHRRHTSVLSGSEQNGSVPVRVVLHACMQMGKHTHRIQPAFF